MTTGREWPATSEVRTWAAGQVGVAADTPPEACRAAALRALPDDDFVPLETFKSAARLVTSAPGCAATGALRDLYLRDIEASLRERIDEFAAQFFTLDIPERRKRYEELQKLAAPLPSLLARLRSLEKGLQVEQNPSAGLRDDCAELCDNVCDLFTLAPLASIARRQELQAQWTLNPDRWQSAATQLCEFAPRVAALQDLLLERLRQGSKLREAEARRRRAARARTAPPAPTSGESTANPGRYAWLIIAVVVGLLRLVVGGGSHRDSTPRYNPPSNVTLPDVKLPPLERLDDFEFKNGVWVPKPKKDPKNGRDEAMRRVLEEMRKEMERTSKKPGEPVGPPGARPEGRSP